MYSVIIITYTLIEYFYIAKLYIATYLYYVPVHDAWRMTHDRVNACLYFYQSTLFEKISISNQTIDIGLKWVIFKKCVLLLS